MSGRALLLLIAILAVGAAGVWAGARFGASWGLSVSPGASAPPASTGSATEATPPEGAGSAPGGETPVVARVEVAKVQRGTIDEDLEAYGTVVAAFGETTAVSVPYECRVRKVLVAGGQVVAKGDPLVEIEPSPDTSLELDQATSERDSAKASLDLVEQRLEMKLATREDVLNAQQALHAAEQKLQSLQARGIDGVKTIPSSEDAVVNEVQVEPGAIVAAGAPLLTQVGEEKILVRLGIEAEDVCGLHLDQEVKLDPVNAPGEGRVEGRVHLITRRVDPDTRLVDVFVAPAAGARLLLNSYVRGTLTAKIVEGLLVPRTAVRPEDGKPVLYTVVDDKAVRHVVATGVASSSRVQILSDAVHEGDVVVVTGNAELEDGMAVEAGPSR